MKKTDKSPLSPASASVPRQRTDDSSPPENAAQRSPDKSVRMGKNIGVIEAISQVGVDSTSTPMKVLITNNLFVKAPTLSVCQKAKMASSEPFCVLSLCVSSSAAELV